MKLFDPEALVATVMTQLGLPPSGLQPQQPLTVLSQASGSATPDPIAAMQHQISSMLAEVGGSIDPEQLSKLQQEYSTQMAALWQDMMASKLPSLADRRFSAPEWMSSPTHAFTAASYLLNSHFLMQLAESVHLPKRPKQKIVFAVSQLVDAMSPANFFATNPEAQSKLITTRGESLTKGIANMLNDMKKGRISQCDESAFNVGVNVATTAGNVVFENHLFQLIQYTPLSSTVHQIPLLMVPPCINKFYILDLQPDNSVVRYAVEQGHTVFLVSWVNPDESLSHVTWDDYVDNGVIEAIHTVQAISGKKKINTFGFCVGGTLLSTALSVLAARGEQVAASVTLLTTLLDFDDTGILDVFVDEAAVEMREKSIGNGGLMTYLDLSGAFSSLRPNDLIWNYVQSNYLKGQDPTAFDLLYWNGDGTNLPGPMLCWYLRNTYLENSLKVPSKLTVAGQPVDLGKIDAPFFVYGSREDHIVPWTSAYASLSLVNPDKPHQNRFVLGASGHIAGVVNPPLKKKRSYWTNPQVATDAQQWLDNAEEHAGSWWPEWSDFLSTHAGKKVKASSKFGNAEHTVIEPAPGRYVRVRAD